MKFLDLRKKNQKVIGKNTFCLKKSQIFQTEAEVRLHRSFCQRNMRFIGLFIFCLYLFLSSQSLKDTLTLEKYTDGR